MFFIKIIFSILLIFIITKLFKRAAGSLSPIKLNTFSLSYYTIFVYCVIGSIIIFLGFRNHYLIEKVSEESINITNIALFYTFLALPISLIVSNYFFGIKNYEKFYVDYLNKKVIINSRTEKKAYILVYILSILGIFSFLYMFYKIGYIPLFRAMFGNIDKNLVKIQVSRNFSGNEYIKNLLVLNMIPTLSHVSYIYYRTTLKNRWKFLFIILFIFSIFSKTYNLEKSPIIIYLFQFFLIEILIGNVKSMNILYKYIFNLSILFIIIYYFTSNYHGRFFTIQSGPLGRLLLTQIATGYLHFQAFPNYYNYLNGASFPKSISWIFGASNSGNRSGRIVMELFNPNSVADGTAGVMNSIFIAEAYANFGYLGVLISPWVVGFIISFISNFIILQNKTPLSIAAYVVIMITYTNALVGGFVDFVYNIGVIFIMLILISISIISNEGKLIIKF